MWLFTSEGFVSVVAHNEEPDSLLVRARDEDSLLSLVEATGATLRHTPSNDYPYRIEVLRTAYSVWVANQILELDYINYKAHMWSERPEFGQALHDVYASMLTVEGPRVTDDDRQRAKELYPNQEMTDGDIEMAKALGHL
jgi:hypothetical protein